jgi:hypothetical protein
VTEEPRLVVAVDSAVEGDGGFVVAEVAELGLNIVWNRSSPIEPRRALVITDEFARQLGDNVAKFGRAVEQAGGAAAYAAKLFDVPLHILGVPYVVDPHIAGIRIKGGPFVPLKTGPRRGHTRAEWARILRVHRALRRRARRHGLPAPTEQRRAPVGAVLVDGSVTNGVTTVTPGRDFLAELSSDADGSVTVAMIPKRPLFDMSAVRATAEWLNRTAFH